MASSARIDELKKKFDENPRRYFAPLANEYRKVGDLDQAIFICQEYLPQQPGHMSGHIVYAQTLFEMGRYDDAKVAFGTALALDPENMIALRHLGDIARQAGDLESARQWYERVLEADPRNEEIVEAMASLNGATKSPLTSSAPPPPPAPPRAATSLETPVVTPVADRPPPPPTPVFSGPAAEPPRFSPFASAPPTPPAESNAENEHDLLDLGDLQFGGSSPASAADESSAPPEVVPEAVESFESDPFAIASNEPPIELATDLKLGLLDEESESATASTADAPLIEGLRSYEQGVVLDKPAELPDAGFKLEPFYDVLHGERPEAEAEAAAPESALDDLADADGAEFQADSFVPNSLAIESSVELSAEIGEPPHEAIDEPREPTPPLATEIFVTETMAELYLQQGHLDSALDIYRKLLEQRPNDAALLERVRSTEERVFGRSAHTPDAAAQPATSDSTPLETAAVHTGPTIREFLVNLITGGSNDASHSGNGTNSATVRPESPTLSRHTLPGSIDAMFPDAGTSSTDATAATALGEAFGFDDFGDDASLNDRLDDSAHSEGGESAQDRVLSGTTPPVSQTGVDGFSFDQFFSGGASAPAPKPSHEGGSPPVESPDDIAQFNAWLNGLKKT